MDLSKVYHRSTKEEIQNVNRDLQLINKVIGANTFDSNLSLQKPDSYSLHDLSKILKNKNKALNQTAQNRNQIKSWLKDQGINLTGIYKQQQQSSRESALIHRDILESEGKVSKFMNVDVDPINYYSQ